MEEIVQALIDTNKVQAQTMRSLLESQQLLSERIVLVEKLISNLESGMDTKRVQINRLQEQIDGLKQTT